MKITVKQGTNDYNPKTYILLKSHLIGTKKNTGIEELIIGNDQKNDFTKLVEYKKAGYIPQDIVI